jgi:hypothetical protein
MTPEQRAQLIEDIDRSAVKRQGIVAQARLSPDFDITAAWEELDEPDASINARIKKARPAHPSIRQASYTEARLTAKAFLDVSTKLFADMKVWIAEASKEDVLSASDLAMLNAAMKIVERATLKAAEAKPPKAN